MEWNGNEENNDIMFEKQTLDGMEDAIIPLYYSTSTSTVLYLSIVRTDVR
jgi:hypothetical protein